MDVGPRAKQLNTMTIQDLRKQEGQKLGYGSFLSPFDGSAAAYSALSPSIRANPSEFDPAAVATSSRWRGGPLDEYTTGEKISDFFGEVGNQAASINNAVNPFSEGNRKWFLAVAVIGVAAYFLAPVIIRAIQEKGAVK
jgi:hypothetical protein